MNGLTDVEVIKSRNQYGSNSIDIKNDNKFYKIFIESLGDPIIKIMLIALSVRIILMFQDFDFFETLGMLISILLSSLISSLSEYGSNKAFKRLQSEYESIKVRVKRNGKIIELDSKEIVVGDIVYLDNGVIVPADGVILEGEVGVDESSINGESKEVRKKVGETLLKGSIILSNNAIIRIKNVGINTIYGDIAKELNEKQPISPLKLRLTKLASVISKIGYIGAIFVSISFIINKVLINNNFNADIIIPLISNPHYVIDTLVRALILALTILLVVVPEGLPLMVSLILSSNMKRMLKHNVLVRKLVGIETSGSLNVLLTDKTGTLTKGKLSVIGIIGADMESYNELSLIKTNLRENILDSLLYNNESYFENNKIIGGNSTDKALLKFIGYNKKTHEIVDKINFNSDIKYSYVLLDNKVSFYKGASEVIIKKCFYYYDKNNEKKIIKDKNKLLDSISKYTKRGIRVIAISKDNALLGFVLIRDEIRENSKSTLKSIKNAGIHTIMITGDDIKTASSIAFELGMLDKDSITLTHDDLKSLSDEEIISNYKRIKVIARALPKDKSRIATILEKNGLVVGMTGDGVNDAPALKKANVGFAMGSGSEVAKSAADIVILDDNISSIENAILYGRTIFKSIRKFLIFQLTMNICALFLSIVGPFIGITTPVTVMQMLWINMIMDTFAGLAYSFEAPLKRYMEEKPLKKEEAILNKYMLISIITMGLYSSILLVLFYKLPILKLYIRNDYKYIITAFFSLFIFSSVFNAFNARTTRINIFSGIIKNKVFLLIFTLIFIAQIYLIYYGGDLFRTYGLTINELVFIIVLSFSVIPIDILKKIIIKKKVSLV